ncbi:hypothetical protein [Micromonospora sp. RV43]|nr:hypothetical protein [Micromonospora sp. RV43]
MALISGTITCTGSMLTSVARHRANFAVAVWTWRDRYVGWRSIIA